MLQAYLNKAIFITLILISIQATNQVKEFTVDKLELDERQELILIYSENLILQQARLRELDLMLHQMVINMRLNVFLLH